MRTLSADDFPEILQDHSHVFVDFFAPWCPPCMKMLPEFRKASNLIGIEIIFSLKCCSLLFRAGSLNRDAAADATADAKNH